MSTYVLSRPSPSPSPSASTPHAPIPSASTPLVLAPTTSTIKDQDQNIRTQTTTGDDGHVVVIVSDMAPLSHNSSLCNSVSSLSTTSSLSSIKSTETSSSQSDQSSSSSSSNRSDQSSDNSGKKPILKQPQSCQLLTRSTFSTILGTSTKKRSKTKQSTGGQIGQLAPPIDQSVEPIRLNKASGNSKNQQINNNAATEHHHNLISNGTKQMTDDVCVGGGGGPDRDDVGESGSHRIYKNSPFGLTRHYLSMPGEDKEASCGVNAQSNDDTLVKMMTLEAANLTNDYHHQHLGGAVGGDSDLGNTNNCRQEKLMMMIPDSASQLAAGLKRAPYEQPDHIHHHDQLESKQSIMGCSSKTTGSSSSTKDSTTKYSSGGSCSEQKQHPHQPQHQHQHQHHQQRKSSTLLVKFCSIIYATFLIILGCILHIAELRHKSRNSSDHIYSSVVALIGILWLTFLHFDLQRYKKYACKFILIESIFNDHHQAATSASSSSLSISGQSLDKISMNTEVIFKKTAMHLSSQAAAMAAMRQANRTSHSKQTKPHKMGGQSSPISIVSYQNSNNHNHAATIRKQSSTSMLLQFQDQRDQQQRDSHWVQKSSTPTSMGSPPLDDVVLDISRGASNSSIPSSGLMKGANNVHNYHDYHDQLADDDLVPAYRFLHGKMGANFYLKCGMAAFCFGHVIHEGLRFGQQVYFFMTDNYPCQDVAALVAHLITPLYSFYQLFMMFKYSNLVINRFKTLAYFGLMHIIGTSITFWFRTIIEEAFEDFVHKMDYFKATSGVSSKFGLIMPPNKTTSATAPLASMLDTTNSINNRTRPSIGAINSRTNSFLDNTAPSSLFGLASESNYLDELLSSFYSGQPSAASNLYPDSSLNEMSNGDIVNMDLNLPDSSSSSMLSSGSFDQSVLSESIAQSLMTLMSSPVSATISPQLASHLPESYACAQNTLLTTKSMNALPYLYPFTIEYNLLLAATFLGLYFNIGRLSKSGCSNHPFRRELVHNHDNGKGELEYKSNFVVNADCHAANKGLFCGFFVLLVTLVSIVIFFVTINKPSHVQLGLKINLIQETSLTLLILLVTLAGFRQVVKLNRNACLKDKVTTDDVLMLVPLPFFFIHSLLSFRAELASLSSHNHHQIATISPIISATLQNRSSILMPSNKQDGNLTSSVANMLINATSGAGLTSSNKAFDYFKLVTISLHVIVMIEVLVQTNFIIEGMRRCSQSRYLRFKKPGRELITFAILLNITYWIVATFESKSVEQYKAEIEFYGPLPWMFVSHTTLPVMLFYRYHSSVCLAEIWGRAYKPAKKVS